MNCIIALAICVPLGVAAVHGIVVGLTKVSANSTMSFLKDNFQALSTDGVVTVGTLHAARAQFPNNGPQIHFLMSNMPHIGKVIPRDPRQDAAAVAIRQDRQGVMPGATPLYTYDHGRPYGITRNEIGQAFTVDWLGRVRVI